MNKNELLSLISQGRTDFIFELFRIENWQQILDEGPVKLIQWLVYYNDVTAIRAILREGGTLDSINLDEELSNAAFFGHWKMCDFLLAQGANANYQSPETGETPLHNALAKAGRPYFLYVIKLLVQQGADVNAKTIAGVETGAFMRDVRTKGETPLHRAAAFASAEIIEFLLENGAKKDIQDAHGDSPISWASYHLRPGKILNILSWGPHQVGSRANDLITSDHGAGWGNGMDWKLIGDFVSELDLED